PPDFMRQAVGPREKSSALKISLGRGYPLRWTSPIETISIKGPSLYLDVDPKSLILKGDAH
ncbi:MAG: hypothetical protein AB1330_12725, partial [Bacillota bacterium]